ncbi:hypothetical protein [Persicirhabdus sediminis]|uniref:Uncharacterized protein n=1 Tax=Persicirhabdus sediminis TaxID=454144 RepID=A0A8J7SI20_9BACT|nr:hypothetical protein [Persicirhabdus sediminis]MBK1790229.1 hypothetical protein [Persicirhabdus sediminis]
MSEEQAKAPKGASFGFPKSTPKKLQEEIEKLIPKELHEQAIVILRDNEKQGLRDTLSARPYKLPASMIAMLMKNYYSHGCDTATILEKASQLAELISQKGK